MKCDPTLTDVRSEDDATLEQLLLRTLEGDADAFEQLYKLTRVSVYSLALSIVRSSYDAEDIMHDTYISLFGSKKRYHAQGKPMAYLMTVTRNLSLMLLRRTKRQVDTAEDYERDAATPDGVSVEDELLLRQCLETLSESERQIVVLHAVSGLKHKDIASVMSLPLSTVLSKYSRAIKKMQAFMK